MLEYFKHRLSEAFNFREGDNAMFHFLREEKAQCFFERDRDLSPRTEFDLKIRVAVELNNII